MSVDRRVDPRAEPEEDAPQGPPEPLRFEPSVPPPEFGHEELPLLAPGANDRFGHEELPLLDAFDAEDALWRPSVAPMREEMPSFGDIDAASAPTSEGPASEFPRREEISLFPDDAWEADEAVEASAASDDRSAAPEVVDADEPPPPEEAAEEAAPLERVSNVPPSGGRLLPHEAVANFTRSLVTTMNKSTYYQPGHPAHFAVRDELYGELVRLLVAEDQIGFVMQRSNPPEILVDGAGARRVPLNEIMAEGVYQMIVPRFIEYFDRHDLVSLAFRHDLSIQEFGRFIAVWTRPASHVRDRAPLSDLLIAEGVGHISTVSLSELGLDDADLPWQVRICLARLRRDLRTIPLFKTLEVDSLKRVKNQIFSDVVRPLRDVVQLRMLIEFAPRIEHQLANVDDVRDLDIASSVINAVQDDRLSTLTLALLPLIDRAEGDELLRLSGVLAGCAASLLSRRSRESFPALRALHTRDLVTFAELPPALRQDISVERMFEEFQAGVLVAPKASTQDEIQMLSRLVQRVFELGRLDDAARLIEPLVERSLGNDDLAAVAMEAVAAAVPDAMLALMIERLETVHDEVAREPLARLIRSLSTRGARALINRILTHPPSARFGTVWNLLDRMGDATSGPLAEGLFRHDAPSSALRVLLTLAPRHFSSTLADAIVINTRHPVASVRIAALAAFTTVSGPRAADALEHALTDPEPGVVAMALLALIDRAGRPEPARARALDILSQATTSTAQELLLAAIQAACARGSDDPDKASVAAALDRIIHPPMTNIAFGLGKVYPYDPAVVTAAREAMGRVNVSPSQRPPSPSSHPPPRSPSQPPPSDRPSGGAILGRIFRRG